MSTPVTPGLPLCPNGFQFLTLHLRLVLKFGSKDLRVRSKSELWGRELIS